MRRRIRVMTETGVYWPFWESDGGWTILTPDDLGLSAELSSSVRAWYDFWLEHCEPQLEWDSPENGEAFLERGAVLIEQLNAEAGAGWEYQGLPGNTIPGAVRHSYSPPVARSTTDRPSGHWGLRPRQ